MDDDLVAFPADEDNELEEVPSSVRSEHQPPIGILAQVIDHE